MGEPKYSEGVSRSQGQVETRREKVCSVLPGGLRLPAQIHCKVEADASA